MQATASVGATSREETGCVEYRYTIDIEDPLVLELFEQWESAADLETHFATPHFSVFADVLLRAVDGAAEFTRSEVSSAALSG